MLIDMMWCSVVEKFFYHHGKRVANSSKSGTAQESPFYFFSQFGGIYIRAQGMVAYVRVLQQRNGTKNV